MEIIPFLPIAECITSLKLIAMECLYASKASCIDESENTTKWEIGRCSLLHYMQDKGRLLKETSFLYHSQNNLFWHFVNTVGQFITVLYITSLTLFDSLTAPDPTDQSKSKNCGDSSVSYHKANIKF